MLAEEGSGSAADDVNFMTVWGHRLVPGYMLSLQEDGIRAYTSGTTIIDGVVYEGRRTTDVTVRNCTVKNMRGGMSLALAAGEKYVEGCTLLGCETGYSTTSSMRIVDCAADAIYGPVYRNTYGRNGITADIQILPGSDSYYNGGREIAYLGGSNNNITPVSYTHLTLPTIYSV